jgi:Brp/Blh family beta-carotene 15,15'-monooxygenase
MNKVSFLYIIVFLLIISVFPGLESVDTSFQYIVAVSSIVLLGIPHGAIDHIIFLEDNSMARPIHFYSFYFGLIALYSLSWAVFPMWSFILFLVMSAYHFGQSQFSNLFNNKTFVNYILYFAWGSSIISGLILYHIEDILSFAAISADMLHISAVFKKEVFSVLLPLSSIITVLILIAAFRKNQISSEQLFFEIYLFILIHICFYILPLIIGFTLYFVILHSCKVLSEEFNYLKSRRKKLSVISFIKLLIPFTLISVFGGGIIMICVHFQLIEISKVLLGFVLISVLTLPHSVVMDKFYQKSMTKPN